MGLRMTGKIHFVQPIPHYPRSILGFVRSNLSEVYNFPLGCFIRYLLSRFAGARQVLRAPLGFYPFISVTAALVNLVKSIP